MNRNRQAALYLLGLTAGTALVYAGVFRNGFVDFDDNVYVRDNPFTRAGLTWRSLVYAWTTFDTGNWIPLTWMSLQLDTTLFGVSPQVTHGMNLFWHVVNAALLFYFLNSQTGAPGRSGLTAALFALHPLRVESVAWAAERKDVLSTFWLLAALLLYARYSRRPGSGRYGWVGAALLLGLLSKSMLVTLPLLLLLVDYWPLRRDDATALPGAAPDPAALRRFWQARLLEKVPLLFLSMAFGIVTIVSQSVSASLTVLPDLSLPWRLANAAQAYGWYVAKTFWPSRLCALYTHPLSDVPWERVAGGAALLAIVSVWVWRCGRERRFLVFGWLWYLISLLPVIGILQVGAQAYADRYSYVPHLGLLTMLVWEGEHWLTRWGGGPLLRRLSAGAALVACAAITPPQVAVWRSTESLWQRAIDVDSENWFAHFQMGILRMEQGRPDRAERHFRKVQEHRPGSYVSYLAEGWLAQEAGEWQAAEAALARASTLNPDSAETLFHLARVRMELGQLEAARAALSRCVELKPVDVELRLELGVLLVRTGELSEGLKQFQRAIAIDPRDPRGHLNAGLALTELGRFDDARKALQRARALDPENPAILVHLGQLAELSGDLAEAIRYYLDAVETQPELDYVLERAEQLRRSAPGTTRPPGRRGP